MILKQGVNAELLDVPGSPQFGPDGKIVDPLQNPTSQYEINFIGIDGKEVKVPVVIKQKIWFWWRSFEQVRGILNASCG